MTTIPYENTRGRVEDVIEDATWLAQSGCGLAEVARRLGKTQSALEKVLRDHQKHALIQRLRALDPVPAKYLDGRRDDRANTTPRGPVRGTWKVA